MTDEATGMADEATGVTDEMTGSRAGAADRAEPWWTDAVVYQVYPRSFADSDGDGFGDLGGIRQHLDHIADLGVDVVWLSPVFRSPQADNGYDISDYEDIDPLFGTLDEFDTLLGEVHRRGMKLVMDLVVNHSSEEHPWFQAAKQGRHCPKHDWYIWRDPVDGHEPNGWTSYFGGPAWSWDPGTQQYFLHLFTPQQPDLNWDNADMRAAVYAMMNHWLDRGVDGFRMDVINHIAKDPDALVSADSPGYVMQASVHDHLQEMHREVFADRPDRALLTVGEMPGVTVDDARRFTDPDRRELDMVFQFEHVGLDHGPTSKFDRLPFDLPALKTSLARWQTGLADLGWNSLYLANHDQPRPVSRFGPAARGEGPFAHRYEAATLLATVLHLHRGTPYVYQGDEIGMVNAGFTSIEEYRDIESLNWYRGTVGRGTDPAAALAVLAFRSRDNARTPIPWTGSAPSGGFSGAADVPPWIDMGQGWPAITVEADRAAGDRSVYEHYRRLIALRHDSRTVRLGAFALLEEDHPELWAFTRTLLDASEPPMVVVANVSSSPLQLPTAVAAQVGPLVLGNLGAPADPGLLAPWEARVHEVA